MHLLIDQVGVCGIECSAARRGPASDASRVGGRRRCARAVRKTQPVLEQDVADKDILDKDINALNKAADVETEN
jgi:hypothetical protein